MTGPCVQLAGIRIDPGRWADHRQALERQVAAALREERGVLAPLAASEPEDPDLVRVFEVCTDETALRANREAPRFLADKSATAAMVLSLQLKELDALGARWAP